MLNPVIVLCIATESQADSIVDTVVMHGLAACVDRVALQHSRHGWRSTELGIDEVALLMTTAEHRREELYHAILQLLSVERLVMVTIPIAESYSLYLDWLAQQLA